MLTARNVSLSFGPRTVISEVDFDVSPGDRVGLIAPNGGADSVLRPARELSPGERTRAGLALLQARGTTCLVLDEPTNHLDLPAIEQLEQALETYEGTLLLVTHDRRLASAVRVDHEINVRDLLTFPRVKGGRYVT